MKAKTKTKTETKTETETETKTKRRGLRKEKGEVRGRTVIMMDEKL